MLFGMKVSVIEHADDVSFQKEKDNDIILPAPGSREGSREQMSFFSNEHEDGIPLNQFVALESDMSFVSDCENTPKIHPNLDQNDTVSYAYRKVTPKKNDNNINMVFLSKI